MQRSLIVMYRILPLEVLYAVMALVIPFYMLFGHKGYLASYHYFRRRHGFGPLRSFIMVYANHFRFGQIILDRFASYAGKTFRMEKEGTEAFERLCGGEGGFLMLSSHVGNYELAGYSLTPGRRRLYALVFGGETETVMKNRGEMFVRNGITMVPMSSDMSHIFTVSSALVNGDIVSMPGDRIFGSSKSLRAELLGAPAAFPLGPFAIAVKRGVPAVATFVMKESARRYRIIMKEIPFPEEGSADESTSAMASAYARALGEVLGRYPAQWFNFFEFWETDK